MNISTGFERRWQVPHCCGALDGKHCIIQCLSKSGSAYWNYKKSFSVILMVLVNSKYKIIMVDISACGTEGESNTFCNSAFGQQFLAGQIPFPNPKNLPDTHLRAPFVIVGNEAFPSMINLLKPYPRYSKQGTKKSRAVYNYRLSCAWMTVECAFGILASRFCFLLWRMILSPTTATKVIKAVCVLHNFLIRGNYPFVLDAECKLQTALHEARTLNISGLHNVPRLRGFHTSTDACGVWNIFAAYFSSREGHVPWQDKYTHVDDLVDEEHTNTCKFSRSNVFILSFSTE